MYQYPYQSYPLPDQLSQLRQPYQPMYQGQQYPQQPQQVQQPQSSGMLWVNNEMEARNYLVAPNCAVALWDYSAPVVYLKKADASGKPSLQAFDLVERGMKPKPEYATREEISALAARLTVLEKPKKEEQ